ncbi:MAG: lipopolysaccharide biosynthesis protein [Myxococcales bacterium]|nr:lipopolysaccharide biosynthesis protein [Myxococcales bacterium]
MLWSFALQLGTQLVGGVSAFVLAYLVGPYTFGLVSMAAVAITFLFLFLEAGLVTAIIQRKDLEDLHLDSVFWLNLVVGIGLTGLAIAGSGLWAQANRTEELGPVMAVLALQLVVQGVSLVQQALAQRDMDFKSLAMQTNLATALAAVVAVTWAWIEPGWEPLVAQRLLAAGGTSVLLWRVVPWRPSLRFSWRHAREIVQFSSGVLLSRVGMRVAKSSDALLLGLFFGPETVGVFRLARRVCTMAYTLTTKPLGLVAMPLFAERQDEPERLRETLVAAIRYSTMATMPILMALAAVAVPLTATLGPEWAPAGPPLAVLAAVGAIRSITAFTDPLLFAVGKPLVRALMVGVLAVCNPLAYITAAVIGAQADMGWQLIGIACAELIVYALIFTPLNLWIAHRETHASAGEVWSALRAPVAAGALAAAVGTLGVFGTQALPSVATAAIGGVSGTAAGALWLYAVQPEVRDLWRTLRRRLGGA